MMAKKKDNIAEEEENFPKKRNAVSQRRKNVYKKKSNVWAYVIIGILILIIVLVYLIWSGALWSILGIEPMFAPFEASVQLVNAPPVIVAFRPTSDCSTANPSVCLVSAGLGDVTPVGNGNVWARVTFIVEDPNQPNDLPGVGGPAISVAPVVGAGNVYVTLTSPSAAGNIRCAAGTCRTRSTSLGVVEGTDFPLGLGLTSACTATTCVGGADANCNAATVFAGDGSNFDLQVKYTCYVRMSYWDEPSVSPESAGNQLWQIQAWIKDGGGSTDTVTSGTTSHVVGTYNFNSLVCAGVGDCDYMDYNSVQFVDTSTDVVSWTAVNPAVANQPAIDPDLVTVNKGNQVSDVKIKGQNLIGVGAGGAAIPGSIMRVNAFSVDEATGGGSPVSECGVASAYLTPNVDVLLDNNMPFTAGGNGDLGNVDTDSIYFCIKRILNSLTCDASVSCLPPPISASYAAKPALGFANAWEVTYV